MGQRQKTSRGCDLKLAEFFYWKKPSQDGIRIRCSLVVFSHFWSIALWTDRHHWNHGHCRDDDRDRRIELFEPLYRTVDSNCGNLFSFYCYQHLFPLHAPWWIELNHQSQRLNGQGPLLDITSKLNLNITVMPDLIRHPSSPLIQNHWIPAFDGMTFEMS